MRNLIVSLFILSFVSSTWADDVHECHLLKTFVAKSGKKSAVQDLLADYETKPNTDFDIRILVNKNRLTIDERDVSVATLEACLQKANDACQIPEGKPTEVIESKIISVWFNGQRNNDDFKCNSKKPLYEKINAGLENLQNHISVDSYKHLIQISDQLKKRCNIERNPDGLDNLLAHQVFYDCKPGSSINYLNCAIPCGNEVDATPEKTPERRSVSGIRSKI